MQCIIPRLRSEVFEGVHILFSSVIPLDTQPETTEIWRMAHMFGARVSTELKNDITHVVAAKVRPNLSTCHYKPGSAERSFETLHACSFSGIGGTVTD